MKKNFIFLIISIFFFTSNTNAYESSTGLKLPRYVSLKSNDSNLRIGSGLNYPIKIKYKIANMPIEIIDEYEDWRKINDFYGHQGWLHKSLIKGYRYAIINTSYKEAAQIYNKPKGIVIGKIGNRNIIKINKCTISWCHISLNKNKGWINKINLWGVYSKEELNLSFYHFVTTLYWKII